MSLDQAKTLAEMIALVAAAVFFLWKVGTGYNIINLSLALETQRTCVVGTNDDLLVVQLGLEKGDRAKLSLTRATICVLDSDGKLFRKHHLSLAPSGKSVLKMTPGEKTLFECCFKVSSGELYEVRADIEGKARTHGPWRSTTISVPLRDVP